MRPLNGWGKMKKKNKENRQQLLPAAQNELNGKVQQLVRAAYHAEALDGAELVMRGMKMKAIRAITDNAELLEIAGYNRIEDFFDSLGIKRRQGFYLKKIAGAFSEEEVQTLHSMKFSQRDILRLASLPPGQLPKIEETDDPDELKAVINNLLSETKNIKSAALTVTKQKESIEQELKTLKSRMPNQHNMDWAWLSIESISKHISGIQSDMNFLLDSMDHRLVGNSELNARVNGLYDTAQRMLIEVFDKIDKLTGHHPGREKEKS
jgi:hypothetical protein